MGLLTDFRLSAAERNLGIYGVHVHQGGRTIAEHRFRSDDRENLYSAAKTFVSVGIGIAEGEGLFRLSNCALDFFPEYRSVASAGAERITIRSLLQMCSGHMAGAFPRGARDWAEAFFAMEMKAPAGTQFHYEDLCTYLLGRIVEKGSGETLLAYLKPRLFAPLGIENPQWHTCPLGHTECSGGLTLTTEELSRIGILLLGDGAYGDKQVVPEDYVRRMRADWADSSSKDDPETRGGYGYQVWKCTVPGAYRADGMYGQFCVVLPGQRAVVTVTAHNETEPKDILRAIWRDILPLL